MTRARPDPAPSSFAPPGRYAPSAGNRWAALALTAGLHLALLVLLQMVGAGTPRARHPDMREGGMMTFSLAAVEAAAPGERASGRTEGEAVPAPPVPVTPAEAPAAHGAPDAPTLVETGAGGALSRAIADAIADDPAGAGEQLGYRRRLIEHIRRFLAYPSAALDQGLAGTVTVRFRIQRDGQVLDLRVIGTHGAVLDAAAMGTIWRAEPVPALPRSLPAPWEVDVPIAFEAPMRRGR